MHGNCSHGDKIVEQGDFSEIVAFFMLHVVHAPLLSCIARCDTVSVVARHVICALNELCRFARPNRKAQYIACCESNGF